MEDLKKKNILSLQKKFNNQIDYWISEKDKRFYDGWNKVLKLCLGKYIGIINSMTIIIKMHLNI